MIPIRIEQLAEIIKGRVVAGDAAGTASGVSIDSRAVSEGDVFFAIRGERFDGHTYVHAALGSGAVCAVVEREMDAGGTGVAVIVVEDTITALGALAAWYRQQLQATVIAITGSAGKTTTRHILYQVLSHFYRCRQAPKSFNNHIGLPLAILSAEAADEILLLELGANGPGEIAELTAIARPDAAVITFIGPAHLEGFGTLDNILTEKVSIVRGLKADGILYINGDQPELVAHAKNSFSGRIITSGTAAACDIIGTDFQMHGDRGSLVIDGQRAQVPLAGRANLTNVLTVWSVCRDLKIGLSDYVEVIGRLKPISMRLEVVTVKTLTILNDCYNANPASMANALETLIDYGKSHAGRLVFVAGSMYELGSRSAALHEDLGRQAAETGVAVLLCVGRYAEQIAAGAAAAGTDIQVHTFETTETLCNNLHKTIRPDDIVLVKGSRAAGLEKTVERLYELV